ncbi:MAG: hypothetical protein DCF23_03445 [Cyanobium sp.]|nr:MAG: hypothetical protein DCF23_03445 [Cyanobium sp.]
MSSRRRQGFGCSGPFLDADISTETELLIVNCQALLQGTVLPCALMPLPRSAHASEAIRPQRPAADPGAGRRPAPP